MITVTNTCPSLEDIAAFLDGRLSEGERARVVAHLADCESCYAVFAGAARFQLMEEEEEARAPEATEEVASAPVVLLQTRTSRRWALPLAALLVLGLASIPLYQQYTWVPQLLATELVNPVALKSVPTSSLWAEDTRGGPPSALDTAPAELLVGAHLVDLRLVVARNDREETKNVLSRINGLIDDLLFVDEQAGFYRKAVGDLSDRRATLQEVARGAVRTEVELTEIYSESPYLAFGKWAEAGRLSAIARDSAFFQDRDNRRFPGWLLRKAEEELDPGVVRAVQRIRDIVKDNDPSELPYDGLADQFDAILRHYQREADAASLPLIQPLSPP